jgi:hypothetical protein
LGTGPAVFHCLDARIGVTIWSERATAEGNVNSTALCTQGLVAVGTNEKTLVAFEQGSGRLVWREELSGPCTHELLNYGGLIAAPSHSLTLHSPETGQQEAIWSWPGESVWSIAIAGEDALVHLTTGLLSGNPPKERAIWINRGRPIEEGRQEISLGPVRYDPNIGRIYSSSLNRLSIIAPEKREIEWEIIETDPRRWFGALPDSTDGILYLLGQTGRVVALQIPVL